jgi:formate dehydrogenase maturation protein FdhE
MDITQSIKNKYFENPDCCPICNSLDLTADEVIQPSPFKLSRKVECKGCLNDWQEVFTLTNIENN